MIQPPVAQKIPQKATLHGDERVDDYAWLRDRESPEVIAYLEAENAYTKAKTEHIEPLSKTLYAEMLGRIKEDDRSVPVKDGEYFYYTRTESKKAYRLYCRKKGSLDAEEEVLLDVNALAKDHEYTSLGAFDVSPDHSMLAYSVDHAGDERFELRIKRLDTGAHLKEKIDDTYYGVEWGNDNQTLFYVTVDETTRPYRLHRHTLGAPVEDDVVVVEENDEAFHLSVHKTRSEKFIVVGVESAITTEISLIDADHPTQAPRVVLPRRHGVEYDVAHHGAHLLILTNEDAENFKLMLAPVDRPDEQTELIAHRESVSIEDVDAFRDYLVLYERENALTEIRVMRLGNEDPRQVEEDHRVEFPDAVFTSWGGDNREFVTDTLRFGYTSLTQPASTFDYDLRTRARTLLKEREVIGYDKTQYQSERVWATAPDGVKVPISLHYKKGFVANGTAPLLLEGYGAYGAPFDPEFDANMVSFTDRGFVVAIAHVRGGGDLGRRWKNSGKLDGKIHSFRDLIACAEHLVEHRYAARDRVGIMGASAGGLLVGAAVNMRPELFRAMVARVPFVDVVNTMLDESIPLTVVEWEEWGNPNNEADYRTILEYSPYDNVRPAKYPDMLVTAGLNDPRVQYWEPAKWVAKLRATETGDHMLLLKTNMGAGHGGASGRYGHLEEKAFEYAFLIDRLAER